MEYISYSQYTSYQNCPRNWYLGKVRNAESKQTWYIPIGSAVHEAIQNYLMHPDKPNDVEWIFYQWVEKQMKIEPDTSKWMHGGSREEPIIEELALKRAQDCFDNALVFLEDFEAWEIEYDVSGSLPGLSIPVKGFVDIIGEHKKYGPGIVDWKTGAQKPKDNFQLETYKALLDHNIYETPGGVSGRDLNKGLWAMLSPNASKARPVDLSNVSPKDVGAKYQTVVDQMEKKLYQTKHGYNCRFCFNQENCLLEAGPTKRARYYDRSEEDGFPY